MATLDLQNLPDDAEVERIISTFDNDDCAWHLHDWRRIINEENLDPSVEQNRAMILVTRRIRALRENSRGGKKKAAPKKQATLDDLL